ncbi:3-carboxy-cis,cis-muconate cycloisomerase [Georgenia yuyongxinii]|uniref:3-carboxy-cis,cis-muconate cycloisomerase n=1 Tax=Georgenia yuyongxinii TaxID=2589797 RepID=A0A5B8C1M3_9MICO|nr:lyase family protein [Georgenia yuyongxinii]QDC24513.1 3-carboxy-cis,cis-muconate cycloisomerase [Georgenia yuyongxinii]
MDDPAEVAVFDDELFGYGPGGADADHRVVVDDAAVVAAMLRAEVALLRALQTCGVVPDADGGPALALAEAAARLTIDVADLGLRARGAGNPVVPLVKTLLVAVPEDARPWVHYGATSQDIVDTALMLLARDVSAVVAADLRAATEAAAALAADHRGTVMAGRTLGQVAVPTTFGLKAAGWAAGLAAAAADVERVKSRLAVQLAGAAGTLAVYGAKASDVVAAFAAELGLAVPAGPWHTERSRVRELAGAFAGAVAAPGKVATDVVLMAMSEVGELREGGGPGHGGSSAMPHKQNPVTSVLLRAAAVRAPGLLGTVHAAALQEHERAAGAWHAEWQPLEELLRLAAGSARRVRELLEGLDVDAARMAANLDAARPWVMAEALATRLAPRLGRAEAQDLVKHALEDAARDGVPTDDALLAELRRHPAAADLPAAALDPRAALEGVDPLIDAALAAVRG